MSMSYELMMRKKGMPSRYQEVEYIESTRTQYIDTGLIPKVTFKYKIKYSLNSIENQTLFGSRTSGTYNTSRNQIYFNVNSNSLEGAKTYLLNIYGVNNVDLDIVPTQNVIVETPIIQNENCVLENATRPIYLFALNNQGSAGVLAKTKMYYLQIYDNGTLVRNFVPVYDTETQKYGMWESVQGKFYGNAGTGDFKGSIVGYTKVGSPTITDGVVSGFSSANYLTLPDVDFSSNFESQVAFKINTYSPCGIFCLNSYDYKGWHCIGSNILAFSLHITNGNDTKFARLQLTVSENTDYIANAKRIGNNVVCSLYSNGTLVSQQSVTIDEGYDVIEGVGYNIGKNTVGAFDGTIDLNNTYIKINNKLWFNGQPA